MVWALAMAPLPAPTHLGAQGPVAVQLHSTGLRNYAGVYRWDQGGFIYLQLWAELTGKNQLVAFDESGEVRALYPNGKDRFTAGAAAAIPSPVASAIAFGRNSADTITSLSWEHDGVLRHAQRVSTEDHEDVSFSNGAVRLAGTLVRPRTGSKRPAIILVHASGAEDREYLLPFAHFLVRRGIAVLGYDKRGVGASSGDWQTASFDDLAGDVVAAVAYLKRRPDIDAEHIGLLGWSQAGWIMPLAAVRDTSIAFLVSISGAAISPAQTTLDQTRNELTARGMKPEMVQQILALMKVQYEFARTGNGWSDYIAGRDRLVQRLGQAPLTFPATADDPYWAFIRRIYFYDPHPALRRLRTPTLALFGELDGNILAEKNASEWKAALKAAGNADFAAHILPLANHLLLEARNGSIGEIPSLQRFSRDYFAIVNAWLAKRVPGFRADRN